MTSSMKYPEWLIFVLHAQWIMTTGLAIGVLVDGLIAICISYYLLKGRSMVVVSCVHIVYIYSKKFADDLPSTRNIINTLLMYTLTTGAILM